LKILSTIGKLRGVPILVIMCEVLT